MRARCVLMVAFLLITAAGACARDNGGGGGGADGAGDGGGSCDTDCITEVAPRARIHRPAESSPVGVAGTVTVPAQSHVLVDRSGAADVTFRRAAACQLTEVTKVADLQTRTPANAFFTQDAGRTHCVFSGRLEGASPIELCGIGELLESGVAIGRATCENDPVFEVAVYRGTFLVTDPSGTETALAEGLQLRFDFDEGVAVVEDAVFAPEEIEVFERLAASIDLEIPPEESPTSIPPPPAGPDNLTPPTITREDVQAPLVADPGEWSGDPTLTFQWEGGCNADGTECYVIEGAVESTYEPRDDCPFVRVVVTATNEIDSASMASAPFDLNCGVE